MLFMTEKEERVGTPDRRKDQPGAAHMKALLESEAPETRDDTVVTFDIPQPSLARA